MLFGLILCLALAQGQAQSAAEPAASAPALGAAPTPDVQAQTNKSLPIAVNVVNSEDLLDYSKTLVVPAVYVTLLTDGRISAAKQSGMFQQGNNSVRASARYTVQGLDKAYAQQLAQAAQDDLVGQLRHAGFTVLTYADIKDRELIKAAQRETDVGPMGLPVTSDGGNNFVTAAPLDEQFFKSSLVGGQFSEFIRGGKSKITDATLLLARYNFASPQSWAETNSGYKSISAEANVAPGMNLNNASVQWMGAPKVRIMRGIPGVATKQLTINVTESAGALVRTSDNTPTTANLVSGLLGRLTGLGSIQSAAHDYVMTIDRAAYTAGVMSAVRSFNAEVAKAAASATP